MTYKTSDMIVAMWGGLFIGFILGIILGVVFQLFKCSF
jgi:hypothetical protein